MTTHADDGPHPLHRALTGRFAPSGTHAREIVTGIDTAYQASTCVRTDPDTPAVRSLRSSEQGAQAVKRPPRIGSGDQPGPHPSSLGQGGVPLPLSCADHRQLTLPRASGILCLYSLPWLSCPVTRVRNAHLPGMHSW